MKSLLLHDAQIKHIGVGVSPYMSDVIDVLGRLSKHDHIGLRDR